MTATARRGRKRIKRGVRNSMNLRTLDRVLIPEPMNLYQNPWIRIHEFVQESVNLGQNPLICAGIHEWFWRFKSSYTQFRSCEPLGIKRRIKWPVKIDIYSTISEQLEDVNFAVMRSEDCETTDSLKPRPKRGVSPPTSIFECYQFSAWSGENQNFSGVDCNKIRKHNNPCFHPFVITSNKTGSLKIKSYKIMILSFC